MTVSEIVNEALVTRPEKPFLIDHIGNRKVLFRELASITLALRDELEQRAVGRGDRVTLLMENSLEFACLYFTCLFNGIVAVPVNPDLQSDEIGYILRTSASKLLICSVTAWPRVKALAATDHAGHITILAGPQHPAPIEAPDILSLDPEWASNRAATEIRIDSGSTFAICFTSGTTNVPKGVVHLAESVIRGAKAFNDAIRLDEHHCLLHVFPMAYMAGFLNTLICPFLAGATVVLSPKFDTQVALRFWRPVIQHGVNALWLSPTMMAGLLRLANRAPEGPDYCRRKMKIVCVGTAPLPERTRDDFEATYGVSVWESYGMSEALFIATNMPTISPVTSSVGKLIAGVEINISQEGGDVYHSGEGGELLVRTPYLMQGYLDPDTRQVSSVSRNEWFPTGDIGFVDEQGHVFITGRKKDLIIRGGMNISPRYVEEALLKHPAVAQVAVVGIPDEMYGEEVAAVIVLKPGHSQAEARTSLDSFCRRNLSANAMPKEWAFVDGLPCTTTGKVKRGAIREMLIARRTATGILRRAG